MFKQWRHWRYEESEINAIHRVWLQTYTIHNASDKTITEKNKKRVCDPLNYSTCPLKI